MTVFMNKAARWGLLSMLLLPACGRPHFFCKNWEALDHQAMMATWDLNNDSDDLTNCSAILSGEAQSDIDDFKKRVAATPMNACSRAAYDKWLSYHQHDLDAFALPDCRRQQRIANSKAKLAPLRR